MFKKKATLKKQKFDLEDIEVQENQEVAEQNDPMGSKNEETKLKGDKNKKSNFFSSKTKDETYKERTEDMLAPENHLASVKLLKEAIRSSMTQDQSSEMIKNLEKNLADRGISEEVRASDQLEPILANQKGNNLKNKKASTSGTFKASLKSASIRNTCRFDFNPSRCKDFHDAGYCVFGDSCIYIHDRGDYKSGWELEEEWEKGQKAELAKKFQNYVEKNSDSEEEDFERCPICQDDIRNPIVTVCGHLFCEDCIFEHSKESPDCFQCGKPHQGIFNSGKRKFENLRKRKSEKKKEKKNLEDEHKNHYEKVNMTDLADLEAIAYKKIHLNEDNEDGPTIVDNPNDLI